MKICVRCGYRGVTWSDSKRSYARMREAGVDDAKRKELSPMCGGKCTTAVLKEMGYPNIHDPEEIYQANYEAYTRRMAAKKKPPTIVRRGLG